MDASYNTTFVTACYNCNKGSDFFLNRYLRKALRTILIPCPLVVFCEATSAPIFRTVRELFGLGPLTHIIEQPLEDLFFYKYAPLLTKRGETPETNYTKITHCVMLNKFKFMLDAITENRFGTSHIGWIDCNLLDKTFNDSINYMDTDIYNKILHICRNPKPRFSIEVINQWTPAHYADLDRFYSSYPWIVAGGFLTTEIAVGTVVCTALIEKAIEITTKGYGSTEENVYAYVIDDHPDLFNLSIGDYQDSVHNYYGVTKNHAYVQWVLDKWAHSGRPAIYEPLRRYVQQAPNAPTIK